jgi:ribosome-associated protein
VIEINRQLSVPEEELSFTASRSSGPGGQHVNKASTRVTLHFDVQSSPSLSEYQKRRIVSRLSTRINRDGVLKLHCQRHRSQSANREELVRRFADLLGEALRRRRARKKTRPSREAVERRLDDKKRRGRLKRERSRRRNPED